MSIEAPYQTPLPMPMFTIAPHLHTISTTATPFITLGPLVTLYGHSTQSLYTVTSHSHSIRSLHTVTLYGH